MADISCNLTLPLLKSLEEEIKTTRRSTTSIVQEALTLYFEPKGIELAPTTLTIEDMDEFRNLMKSMQGVLINFPIRVIEPQAERPIEEPEQKGLIIPDMTKTRVRPDPSIKHVSLFAHEIKPGPGVTNRLLSFGITPIDIVKAKRNRAAGRDWDQSLEPYFDLL